MVFIFQIVIQKRTCVQLMSIHGAFSALSVELCTNCGRFLWVFVFSTKTEQLEVARTRGGGPCTREDVLYGQLKQIMPTVRRRERVIKGKYLLLEPRSMNDGSEKAFLLTPFAIVNSQRTLRFVTLRQSLTIGFY